MDVEHVADAVLYMASLPLDANVQFMTVMATKMPFVGAGVERKDVFSPSPEVVFQTRNAIAVTTSITTPASAADRQPSRSSIVGTSGDPAGCRRRDRRGR